MIHNLRILVVDDDRRMTNTLSDILRLQGYETTQAFSGLEAIEQVNQGIFDCVLTDIKMSEMDGVELFQELHKYQPGLPVVFMTAYASDDLIQDGLNNGAVGVLNKPIDIHKLLGFLDDLGQEHIVTVVDDDPAFCTTLTEILERRGFRTSKITDPNTDVMKIIEDAQIIILDLKLNHVSGLEVLRQIRIHHPTLPVVLVTGYRVEMDAAIQQAREIINSGCLYKPLVISELVNILAEIQSTHLKGILKAG